jgi:hypothetical protein
MLWSRLLSSTTLSGQSRIGPEPLHQLIFAEQTPVVFDKQAERVEDLSAKRNQFARTQQAAFRDVEFERFEMKNHNPPSQSG